MICNVQFIVLISILKHAVVEVAVKYFSMLPERKINTLRNIFSINKDYYHYRSIRTTMHNISITSTEEANPGQ